MKRLFTTVLLCVSILASAQIVPVHTFQNLDWYSGTPPYVIHLTNFGDKYVEVHGNWIITQSGYHHPTPDTMFIWNSDFTPFRSILLSDTNLYFENIYNPNSSINVPGVSDKLFNLDTTLELIVRNKATTNVSIISETGNLVLASGPILRLIKMDEHYYATTDSVVYSLPGTLPCMQCSNISTGLVNQPSEDDRKLLVYPNPFNQSLAIRYSIGPYLNNAQLILTDMLGRELYRQSLTKQSDEIQVSTSNLSGGTIIVSITNGNSAVPLSTKAIKVN
ncbi:MAG: T9SS type A sorting domain-containing protein [Bacteroidetes bacterium]|nr:T9SS type A sorting domain-containing protein [Bacteroidota bacterium]